MKKGERGNHSEGEAERKVGESEEREQERERGYDEESGTRRTRIVGRTGARGGVKRGRIAGAAREDIDIFGRGARIAEEARGCAGGWLR